MARTSIATDNFNRADGAIGSDWSYIRLSSWQGNPPHVVSNALAGRALGTNHQVVRWNGAGSFSDDQYAKIALGGMGWFGTDYMIGAVVRCSADTDANADYYAFLVIDDQTNGGNKTCKLVKRINGTETVIDTITTTSWTNGDTVELEAEGTTLRIYKNGTQIGSDYTSQSDLSTGKPGILIAGDLAGPPAAQDWEGGDVVSIVTPTAPTSVTAGSLTTTGATANWVDASNNETGFDVQIAAGPSYSSWSTVAGSPVAANVTSLAATGLSNATSYKFRVRAFASGQSSWVESDAFLTQTPVKLRPSADITVGSWAPSTGTSLFAVLDESSPDDGDYVSITGTGTFEIQLTVGVDPTASYGHTVRYRIQGDGAKTFTVRLIQGTTIISTDPTVRVPPAGSWTTYEWTLTAGEANAISNYADLRGRVTVA